MRLFSYIFLFLLTTWQLIAQTYPMQVVPVLTPPYSSKIADYANPMANKVQLQLITTDLSVQNRPVQLYVEIKGNGLTAASAPILSGVSPLRISGGEILRLTNAELASYFQLRNLQGITSQQYASALPDGMYSFCFRVKDVLSGRWLSQSHCAIAYLMLNDPPILNIPTDNEQVAVTDFQNIIFSWTPRQINATNVTYSFELREILDPTLDPRFAFEVSRRILKEDDLRMTTFVYDVSKPNLIPSRRYAWRVRAISTGGLAENSVFKNNGYSEVHTFVYAVNCSKPLFLLSEQQGKSRTKLLWQGHTLHQKYHIQYRKKNVEGAQWFETFTRNTQTLIANLEAGEYEFRVGASCEGERYGITPSYVYSDIQTFKIEKTPNTTEQGYNCGIVPKITITNQKPLNSLVTNEVFTAGDFAVTLLEVSGSNGVFSGKGFIKVPYLNDTKLAVEFENVKINSDYQLTDGVVKTTYDADWKNVQFIENLIGQGKKSNEINVPFEIDKVETHNGEIVVTGKDGRKEVFPFGGNDSTIKGKVTTTTNGVTSTQEKIYHIDKDGKVSEPQTVAQGGKPTKENTNGVSKGGEATALTAKGIEVTFENTADSKYAYEVPTKAYSKDYQKLDGKYIPFKAVVKGETEPFLAKVQITNKNISADSLIFKTDKGALIESKRVEGSNDFLLTLKGFHSFAVEQVQATIKQGKKYQIAGVFNLVHLSPKTAKVILVPTSENTSMDIDRVKSIYSKIGVNLDITWAAPFDITPYLTNGSLETNDVFGDLTDYSPSQQAIINAYKATGKVANDTYYVFITNAKSSTGQGGYMALGGQFGFVFDQTERTLAHELGHGIFKLAHPFKKKQQGNVPSLMDYTSDEALLFADWKQINDPAFKIGIFQGQSEGEFAGKIWLTPDWRPFKYDSSHITAFDRNNLPQIPKGALPAILGEDKNAYYAEFSNGKFIGYKNSDGLFLKLDYQTSVGNETEIYLYRIGSRCGSDTYYKTTWGYIKDKKGKVDFLDKTITLVKTVVCNDKVENQQTKCNNFVPLKKEELSTLQSNAILYLKQNLQKINSTRGELVNTKGNFSHIYFKGKSGLGYSQLQMLEDKLHLLSYYTNVDMVLSILPITNNSMVEERVLSDMAKKAIKAQKSSRRIVYILVSTSNYESILGEGLFNSDSCYSIGYAESQEGILSTVPKGNTIFENVVTLFKGIEKPLLVNRFYCKADGTILNVQNKYKESRNNSFIHFIEVYESDYYEKIKAVDEKLKSEYLSTNYTAFGQVSAPNLIVNRDKILSLEEQRRQLLLEANTNENLENSNSAVWKPWKSDDENILREVFAIDPQLSLANLKRLRSDVKFFENSAIYHQMQGVILNPNVHFYSFKGTDLVYLFADSVGAIPVIDILGDLTGFIYASYRGDWTETSFYSLGMAIPIGGVYLKTATKADELVTIVAREAKNGESTLEVVPLSEKLTTDIALTSPIVNNSQEVGKVLEDVRKLHLENGKQIANLAERSELLSKEGKFIDNALEQDYQKYLSRKSKESKSARDRLSWKEERDYWLYDSPIARGNKFNKKAIDNDWYEYNEVHLENGKRLDSYDEIKGEIVSRKATDLESIELSTFESYLK